MKTLKMAVPILLVAVAALYLGSPYLSASGFSSAMKEYNAAEASEYIDYTRVRQGLKDDLSAEIAEIAMQESEDNPFAAAGAAFAGTLVNGMIDKTVTPAGLEKMLSNAEKSKSSEEPKIEYDTEYDGLNRFLVTMTQKADGRKIEDPITLVFERQGLFDWKMVEVDLPMESLKQNMWGQAQKRKAPSPKTVPVPTRQENSDQQNPKETQERQAKTIEKDELEVIQKNEQPGFFYEVDEDGNPVSVDSEGNPIPSRPG